MQQYEVCVHCRSDHEYEEVPACGEGECDFGFVEEYERCERCDKLLRAIKAVEEEEGCSGNETQPALTQLYEAMTYEENKYGDKARELFPEIVPHLYKFGEWWDSSAGWSQVDLVEHEHWEYGGES